MSKAGRQRGQVGMTVLLILVIMVTIAVAVASRSVSNLNLTRKEQESTRTLDLAESGLEMVLNRPDPLPSILHQVSVKDSDNNPSTVYVAQEDLKRIDVEVEQGHTVDVLLSNTSSFDLSWECDGNPLIEVTFLKEVAPDYYTHRKAFENMSTGGGYELKPTCNTTITGNIVPGHNLNTYTLARIKVLRRGTTIHVSGDSLPKQGIKATATASTPDTEEVTTTVQKAKYRGSLPTIFDYVVFSGSQITKN